MISSLGSVAFRWSQKRSTPATSLKSTEYTVSRLRNFSKSGSAAYRLAASAGNRVVAIKHAPARNSFNPISYPLFTLAPVSNAVFPVRSASKFLISKLTPAHEGQSCA